MRAIKAASGIIVTVLIVAVCGGGYLWYRNSAANSLDTESIVRARSFHEMLDAVAGLPASQCAFYRGGFDSALSGNVYVAHGMIRLDLTNPNHSEGLHVLVNSSEAYFWTDSSRDAYKTGIDSPLSSEVGDALHILSAQKNCQPVWSVGASVLKVPDGLTIQTLQ